MTGISYHVAHNTLGNPCPTCDQPMALSISLATGVHPEKGHVCAATLIMYCRHCNWMHAGGNYIPVFNPDGLGLIERGGDDDEP